VQPQVVSHCSQWEALEECHLVDAYRRSNFEANTLVDPPAENVMERMFHVADYRTQPPSPH